MRTGGRPWRLSYGGEDVFYLTKKERDVFLSGVKGGLDTIMINGNAFTRFYKNLTHTVDPMLRGVTVLK